MKNLSSLSFQSRLLYVLMVIAMFFQTGFTTFAKAAPATTALDTPPTFADTPTDHWAHQFIEALFRAGITGGCSSSPVLYCPEDAVTRAQMAIFILRSVHGRAYSPQAVTGTVFLDIPVGSFADAWIEQLAFEKVTAGCNDINYCPNSNVTRAQMAVFLLRGKYGSSYTPPAVGASTGFNDVPTSYWAASWIKQLAAEGITGGCGTGIYCPESPVTRAQMAVFLVRTFNLSLETLPPIIPATTKVLPPTTTQQLSSVSSDGSVFTFSQITPDLDALSPGHIIVGEATSAAPYGFLRKVESVSNSGGQLIVQTQPTKIEDAIQQGEVSISQPLSPTNPSGAEFADGVEPLLTAAALNKISIQLNNVVLYDSDGSESTTYDQVVANGLVSLEPMFDFKLKVQDYKLQELYFTMTANQTTQLKISSKVSVTAKVEKKLASYPMGPVFLTIGPFPVTVYPILTIVAGIDGSISANVSTGVTQILTTTAGARYTNNSWSAIKQFSNQFKYDAPTFSEGLSIKGYIGTKLQILLYGSVGPTISLNGYCKLEANLSQTPLWKLYGGLEVSVGISIEIFGDVVVGGFNAVVIDFRILLAQANTSCTPGQIIYDPFDDGLPPYIDITSLSTALNGETLQAMFHIRDVPPQLTFNRIGVGEHNTEYAWTVYVDVDNNPQTGFGLYDLPYKGAEFMLIAWHGYNPTAPVSQLISSGVRKDIIQWIHPYWRTVGTATFTVNTQSNTMVLTGNIPGITPSSRIIISTWDFNPGGAPQSDETSCSTMATN